MESITGIKHFVKFDTTLVETLPFPAAVHENGILKYCNSIFVNLLQFPLNDITGRSILDFIDPDYTEQTLERLEEYKSDKKHFEPIETVLVNAKKERVYFKIANSVIHFNGARAILAVCTDITQLKNTEEALRKSNAETKKTHRMLQGILDSIPDVIGIQDNAHGILQYNQAGYDYLQTNVDKVQGKRCFELIGNDKPCELCATKETYQTKKPSRIEKYVPELQVWLDCRAYPVLDEQGNLVNVVEHLRDITEQKKAMEELTKTQEQLHQTQKMEAIGQLAGGIAHDFNNQLAGILSFADLLRDKLRSDPALLEWIEYIVTGINRATDLTSQLLAFSRKGKTLSISIDVHSIIKEVSKLLEHTLDKRIELQVQLLAKSSIISGDASQLQNAILNLAINARDAMNKGGTITITTENVHLDQAFCKESLFELHEGAYLCFSIHDNGKGMNKETLERIFEPFFTTKAQGEGTGLGLAGVYGTIKNHKGAIFVQSEPDHGTEFTVYFPLCRNSEPLIKPFSAVADHPLKTGTILVIDDDTTVNLAYSIMLKSLGFRVISCENGVEALDRYKEIWQTIDLVIIDMVMPKLDGRDTYSALKSINPSVKAILMSGYSFNGEAQKIIEEGVKGFLQKPFTRNTLANKIAEVLGTS